MELDTKQWEQFPFTVDGVNFISKIDKDSSMYKQVSALPEGVFAKMNEVALNQLMGNLSTMTRDEIETALNTINEGASYALLTLK